MIKLSNGHTLEYMTASGALGFDGKGYLWEKPLSWIGLLDPTLFTSVAKTLTLWPEKGNHPLKSLRGIPGGFVNAMALRNLGIDWWCKKIGPTVNSKKIPLIISIFGELEELGEISRIFNDFDLVGLEINDSCPNTKTDILQNTAKIISSCETVKKYSRFPIILKLSVNHDVEKIVKGVNGTVEAFSINSVPWKTIFPNHQSPLEKFGGGGVSGKIAQPFTWNLLKKLTELTDIPVIGSSVWNFNDIKKLRELGAKAISFGSIFLKNPCLPTKYVKRDKKKFSGFV